MPDFKRNDRFHKGGRSDFGGPKRLYDATCANCGNMTQVPFKPNGMKPVYCRDCFKPEDHGPKGDFPPRGGFHKKPFGERREFSPRPPHPKPDHRIDDLARKVEAMSATLERIAGSLESMERASALTAAVRAAVPAKVPAKAKAKKPAKKATKKK